MLEFFKSKKGKLIVCIALAIAGIVVIICCNANQKGSLCKGNSSEYDASLLTLNEESVMQGDTVVFVGSDFTIGTKADGQSFVDYLKAVDGLNCAVFEKEGIAITSNKGDSILSLVESIPKEHASPKAIFCEIPYFQAKSGTKFGELSSSYMLSDFDTETLIGAMEYIVCYSKMNWGCPVFFYTTAECNSKRYDKVVSSAREVANKWNMPMLDFTSINSAGSMDKKQRSLYFVDKHNLSRAGYFEITAPEFEKFIIENLY